MMALGGQTRLRRKEQDLFLEASLIAESLWALIETTLGISRWKRGAGTEVGDGSPVLQRVPA